MLAASRSRAATSPTVHLRRFLLLAALILGPVLLSAAKNDPIPGVDAKWRYYQSPNFELYSRNSDGESRDLLYNLELVRAVFFENFKLQPRRGVPMTVFFFAREKYFDAYLPPTARAIDNVAAFYNGDVDRGTLLMAPTPTFEAAQQLAFATYAYHLFRLINERPPLWYVQGVSGIFRNLEISSSYIGFGRPDANQVARLQRASLLPADTLMLTEHDSSVYTSNRTHGLFVDQSWATLHYLYFGQHKIPREQVDRFMDFILSQSRNAGTEQLRAAAQATLGMDLDGINRAVASYAQNGRYGWSKLAVPKVAGQKSYAQRPVSPAEMHIRLAELGTRMNDAPLAKLALLQAAGQPAAEARVFEALGASEYKAGNFDLAAERWYRALEIGTANPAVAHELGVLEGNRKFNRFDLYFRLPDESAQRLRDLLHRSIKAAPEQATAYEILAWVEATAKVPSIANVNLVQSRFKFLVNKPRTLLALALVRLRVNDAASALSMLDDLARMNPDPATAYGAEVTRAKLEDRDVDHSRIPQAPEATRFRFEAPKISPPR